MRNNFWKWLGGIVGAAIVTTVAVTNSSNDEIVATPNSKPIEKTVLPEVVAPKTIVGFNGQLSFNPVDYSDSNFLNAIDSLHPKGIRWPGGSVANETDWKNTSSFLSLPILVNKTHCKISFVLNMITADLPDQLAMFAAAKSQGTIKDKDTFFVEMGNEFNTASRDIFIKKFHSVSNYANTLATWIAAIKKIYPSAQFGVPGGNVPGKVFRDWNKQILAKNPDVFLVWHYHNPREYVFNGIVDTVLVSHLIDSCKQAEFGDFPANRIMVTEYNLRNEDRPDEPVIFKDDVQHGLAASFMMRKFCSMGVYACFFHNAVGAEGNGAIECTRKESHLSATGKALRQYILSYE